ncbi:RrF2 family transcriptional regulator [Rhodococcus opacus]|uniref:RrF2 family transcriptional regulator n=1 Tax=Rhodococcus opacus TaxID=37919 RepID=UPI000AE40EB2|nr:Rrf2 family transcriptional regulator [Rhodococcus opacus]
MAAYYARDPNKRAPPRRDRLPRTGPTPPPRAHAPSPATLTHYVLQSLARAGLVHPTEGRDGGYILTRAPEAITVLDVVQAVDGTEPAFRCTEIRRQGVLAAPPEQCRSACGIAKVMAGAEQAWRASLSGVTIADLGATIDLAGLKHILATPTT